MARKILFFIVVSAIMCFVKPVAANWSYTTGDDGYWQGTHYNYTKIVFKITEANKSYFTAVPVSNFSVSGWTSTKDGDTQATASGPGVADSLTWRLNFTKGMPSVFSFNYFVYVGNTAVYAYNWTLQSGTWTRTAIPAPIPQTVLLMGGGLLGLFIVRRKTRII